MNFWLDRYYLLIPVLAGVFALVLGRWVYVWLERRAAWRLQEQEP